MANYDFINTDNNQNCIEQVESAIKMYKQGRCPVCTYKSQMGYTCRHISDRHVRFEFMISCPNCRINLGPFNTPEDAVKTWNELVSNQDMYIFKIVDQKSKSDIDD